jgi:hypothetical protein
MRKAKAKAAAEAQADDIENVGDQSLMLDEDPSQEYDEMAEETGIVKIAIPQPDENWLKSRQVQPVKDLSVGIAITNDVSKRDNLQTGKITSKFPISIRPASFQHRQGPAVMPYMPHHKGPQGKPAWSATPPGTGSAYFELMREAAAKAAQERDAKARSMVDKRARSMAENAEMQALKRIDNSGMKQYDMKKGPPARSFGIATPTRPTRLPQKRPCSDFGNGYRDDGMGCWLGDEMVVSLSERTGTTDAAVTAVKMKAKMQAKMQAAEAGNKAAMQAAEAAEYAEHQRKQNAAIEVFRFERREAAMKAAKMQAEEAGNKAAMKAAKMQAAEAGNKPAMKAAKMQAEEAGNKAAMKAAKMQAAEAVEKAAMRVEGYEMMQPWGSMVY